MTTTKTLNKSACKTNSNQCKNLTKHNIINLVHDNLIHKECSVNDFISNSKALKKTIRVCLIALVQ